MAAPCASWLSRTSSAGRRTFLSAPHSRLSGQRLLIPVSPRSLERAWGSHLMASHSPRSRSLCISSLSFLSPLPVSPSQFSELEARLQGWLPAQGRLWLPTCLHLWTREDVTPRCATRQGPERFQDGSAGSRASPGSQEALRSLGLRNRSWSRSLSGRLVGREGQHAVRVAWPSIHSDTWREEWAWPCPGRFPSGEL